MGVADLASKLLVVNAGSSSLKFKLFSLQPFAAGIGGLFERIGDTVNSCLIAKKPSKEAGTQKWDTKVPLKDHTAAMEHLLKFLSDHESSGIDREVHAVGHRIVHGLDIHKAVALTDDVLDKVRQAIALAPLHNPPGLAGVLAAKSVFRDASHVAVFDTAYHQTMPAHAYMYGLPYDFYTQYHVRRYGFHGTSHKYLVDTAASMLGKPVDRFNAITCHLGNGSSMTAVQNGLSIDTSMGMTPLEGLIMGTRSGDLDPAAVLYLMDKTNMSIKEMDTLLNKKSGLAGVCGNNDLRNVIDLREKGDERGTLALEMFVYRIKKYLGAYTAALGGSVDAVIFSAGIGENSSYIRNLILNNLQGLGMVMDSAKNDEMVGGKQGVISSPDSRVKLLVVPTDEELSIALQTKQVVFP